MARAGASPGATSTVALLGISGAGCGYNNLASVYLRNWAYRDAELKARLDIRALDHDSAESAEQIARAVLELEPALVGVSCYIWNAEKAFEVCRRLKALSPGVRIVLGGPEVASLAEKTLASLPEADFVACGEGEETFRALLRCLFLGDRKLEEVGGLAYRRGPAVAKTPDLPLIDLALTPQVYHESDPLEVRALLESSRGCPFTCSFCDWGPRKMRYLSLAAVERELRVLVRKVRWIHLCDADLLMDARRATAVMKLFLELAQGTLCTLKFDTNPTFLRPEFADLIARDPMRFYVTLGVQSTNASALAAIHRQFDQKKVDENLSYLESVAPGAQLLMSLIYGLPGDDLEGFRRTLDWSLRWKLDRFAASQLLMIPGADLTREASAAGVRFQARPPYQVLETRGMPPAAIARARALASYAAILFTLKDCRDILLPEAARRGAEGSRIRILEGWIEHLKSRGLDLSDGSGFAVTDEQRVEQRYDSALERLRQDKLTLAAVLEATRRFAGSLGVPA